MIERFKHNRLFQTSHLMLLIGNTVMNVLLAVEAFREDWERWPLVLIVLGTAFTWVMHLRQMLEPRARLWMYAILMMGTFFYYGVHPDSMFDLIAIMACLMMLFTMTGIRGLVTLAQISYYVTMGYEIVVIVVSGGVDGLPVGAYVNGRVGLHVIILTLIAWFSRTIIGKWEQVLEETEGEIDELMRATDRLDDFLANASHEVRTPVNAVIGLAGVCLDRETDEATRKDLLGIQRAGRRVAEQMSDILDYTEIDRERLMTNTENYMISSLLNDVLTEVRPYMKPEVELVMDVDTEIPNVMYSDVSKLKKILWHLIINGLKYTHEGGVYVHITSMKEDYGVNLCIDVADTGIGMNEEEREHMFERFYQADSGRARSSSGLGLGMSIVNGFVRSMGGFLTVETAPGRGTEVHVCVPQEVVDPAPCVSVVNRESISLGAFFSFNKYPIPVVREYYDNLIRNVIKGLGVAIHGVDSIDNLKKVVDSVRISHIFIGMKEYETDPDYLEKLATRLPVYITADEGYPLPPDSNVRLMVKPLYCFPIAAALNTGPEQELPTGRMVCNDVRVLVVDDEPMNLIVAKGVLGGYGMEVETAGSGRTAIEMCSENRYDIVFMDHMMPGMDGVEAMKQIRADIRSQAGPLFVALTANTVSTAREMFRREGFDGFVGKPIERIQLERVLKNILPPGRISYEELSEAEEKVVTMEETTRVVQEAAPAAAPAVEPAAVESAPAPESAPAEEPAAESAVSSHLEALRNCGIDPSVGVEYCQSDESLYEMLLADFAESAQENIDYLQEKYNDENWRDYEIKIHSVKSTSRLIGALALGDMAEALEHASRDGRIDEVREDHADAIEAYEAVAAAIGEVIA